MPRDPRRARKEAGKHAQPSNDPMHGDPAGVPLAYLITFTTFGTWLHGDERGSVDPANNIPGWPTLEPDPHRATLDRRMQRQARITLNASRRGIVHQTILRVAEHRDWTIHALHVRTNHVHLVVSAPDAPERILNSVKSWATRRMVEAGLLDRGIKAWTRHGSTRYLWKQENVQEACAYVCDGQGPDLP